MSKKSKKGIVLLASLLTFSSLAAASLVSCGDQQLTETLTALTISNKAELQAEWRVADADRQVSITADPETFDVAAALDEGTLTVTSSNTSVVSVMGRYLHAVAEGSATITVKYGDVKDTVELTVLPRIEMETVKIEEALNASKGDVKAVKGKILQVSSRGFFVGDDTGIIYVYNTLSDVYEIGDTVNVQGAVDEYGGIKQLTSTSYKIEESSTAIDLTLTFREYTGAELDKLSNAELGKAFPAKITVTVVVDSETDNRLDPGQFLYTMEGFSDTTCLYTGYLNADHLAITGENGIGNRFTMEGLFAGVGSHGSYSKRLNFYPITITEEETIPVEEVTLKADKTTLKVKERTKLSASFTPAEAIASITYEVTEGSDVVSIDGNILSALKTGTATIVAKAGGVTSTPVTITVTDETLEPVSINEVKEAKTGDLVYVKAKYVSTFTSNGTYFADGANGLYVYGYTKALDATKTYLISGEVDIYSGLFQVTDATIEETTEYTVSDPVVTTLTSLDGITGKNAGDTVKLTGKVKETIEGDNYGNAHFTLTFGEGETAKDISVRADSRYEASYICEALVGTEAGTEVTVTAHVSYYKNGLSTLPTDSDGMQLQKIEALVIGGEEVTEPVEPGPGGDDPIPEGTAIAYDFSEIALNEISKFDKDTLAAYLTSTNGDLVTTITSNSAVYAGDSSEGQTELKGLKFGKSKGNGELTFTFSVDIVGVRLKGTQYKTYTSDLAVNGSYKDLNVAQGNTPETLEWGIEATKTITVGTSGRQVEKNYNNRAWLLGVEFIIAE